MEGSERPVEKSSFSPKKAKYKRICLYNDESRWVEFNPNDLILQDQIRQFYDNLKAKYKSLTAEEEEIRALGDEVDEFETPKAGMAYLRVQGEVARFVMEQWDLMFGEGCYQRLFGNVFDPEEMGEVFDHLGNEVFASQKKLVQDKLKKSKASGKKVMGQ